MTETQKNISLKVVDFDRDVKQFEVEYEGKEYNRYSGASLVFACPVAKDDVLYQAYDYRGERLHRFQDVADVEEVNIGNPGQLLFDVDFDSLLMSEIVPLEMKEDLPKSISDRRRIGYTSAKKEGAKSYAVAERLCA